ncbi:MAG: CsbD family protein [Betaproteobacteria bacterium]
MNKDQVKGTVKVAEGKIQQAAGKITGSKTQEAKGLLKEAAGETQKNYGNAKETLKDIAKGK